MNIEKTIKQEVHNYLDSFQGADRVVAEKALLKAKDPVHHLLIHHIMRYAEENEASMCYMCNDCKGTNTCKSCKSLLCDECFIEAQCHRCNCIVCDNCSGEGDDNVRYCAQCLE